MGYKGATKGPQTPGITTSAFILVVIHRKTIMSSQGPIGKLAHGVTSSIGFVSEVHGYRKAKKAARKERELEGQQLPSPSQSPPPDIAYHRGEQHRAPPAEATAHDEVERTWQLDEAQDALVERPTPHKSKGGVANPDKVIAAFLQRRPPPDAFSAVPDGVDPRPRLTYPVAIPQRRPKDKSRGFIHAYALELQTLGIDQDTWFDFIDTFSEASLANPWINALNLASLATSPLPSLISTAISTAIMVATTVAIETQGRYRYLPSFSFGPSDRNSTDQSFGPDKTKRSTDSTTSSSGLGVSTASS